ncbi:MAG: hypothetical protein D6730_05750 [Bacteroidetes bacterium]|nr:MAG: hypothetical protein D6730_05750 [Bacteroidota bacterium]
MLEILTKLTSARKKPYKKTVVELEPHVECFRMDSQSQGRFTLPFYLMTAILGVLVLLAFFFWLVYEDKTMVRVCFWMQLLMAPFYIPGLYYYSMYYEQDKDTELELDKKNELVKYTGKRHNLLFHKNQVEKVEVHLSMAFPYQLDYLSLHLKGGRQIHISSLVIDPKTMIRWFGRKPTVSRRWFNALPRCA